MYVAISDQRSAAATTVCVRVIASFVTMVLLKEVVTRYQHDWGKSHWEVTPKDVVDIGGSQFVKLGTRWL